MSEKVIIQHLMSGINPDFRKELSRRESSINTLNEFLKYAKVEQDLHDTFRNLSVDPQQPCSNYNRPTISSLTATINQPKQYLNKMKHNNFNSSTTRPQSSIFGWNWIPTSGSGASMVPDRKRIQNYSSQSTLKRKPISNRPTSQHQLNNCKVCGRKNHRTIDCYHKRTTGCFNCGQNHNIRDCTLPPNFQ